MEEERKETLQEETAQEAAAEAVVAEATVEEPVAEEPKPLTKKEWQKRNAKIYTVTAFLYGLVCSTLPIIVCELIWDRVAKAIGPFDGLGFSIFSDFFRAALVEEGFKFLGFALAYRKFKFGRQVEAMFAAGTVGLVYAVVEKAVLFNIIPILLGIVFPMHMSWQLNQGRHVFAYREAKARGDKRVAVREALMASLLIFVLHGTWDAMLDVAEYLANSSTIPHGEVYGVLAFVAIVALGLTYTIITFVKTAKLAKKSRPVFAEEGSAAQ